MSKKLEKDQPIAAWGPGDYEEHVRLTKKTLAKRRARNPKTPSIHRARHRRLRRMRW